eukprot:GHUV01055307.1.p1 GENE.GHUV01055307.1~~GHUV01055307.1.p1  ORF type:complete len:167 (-),score=42.47 GHUV01055307.1:1209-1709(-)
MPAVTLDTNRLSAEMKYWLCGEDGETSDILLHVMAQETVRESQDSKKSVGCTTFNNAVKAVNNAVASKKWVAPEGETGKVKQWQGCEKATCPLTKNALPVKLEVGTYIRLLEFGHEQAADCKDSSTAIDTFIGNLIKAGCVNRVCDIMDYVAARPTATTGCKAIMK